MTRKVALTGFIASLLVVSIIAYSLPVFAQGPDNANSKPEIIAVSGIVPGKDLIVHVIVEVQPGETRNEAAIAALAQQGARPFTPHEFTTISLKWDQFDDGISGNDFVEQYYNPKNDPNPNMDGDPAWRSALTNTHNTWNSVTTSSFLYVDAGDTGRCPSLVKECRGPQKFDGNNDVAWLRLSSSSTLGVTWTGTSIDEADMALNTSFNWNGGYDAETVFLHENGHALGLGHENDVLSIMSTYYSTINRSLYQDDIDGITYLYPNNSPITPPTLDGITISSVDGNVNVGSFTQFTATAYYSDGTNSDVTIDASWSSSNQIAATISDMGLAEGIAVGSATITANYIGKADDANLTINPAPETPTSVLATVSYATQGGKNSDKHLIININLDPSLTEASVNITLYRDGNSVGSATGTTNSDGVVAFSLKNASAGHYTTIVDSVISNGDSLSVTTDDIDDNGNLGFQK